MIDDSGRIQLEPTEGQRAPASAGERLLVGLAAVVLGGGLLLAILGSIVGGEEVAKASPTAGATASGEARTPRPSRTPRPAPTPMVVTVEPGSPPTDPMPNAFFGWIRATVDVSIMSAPEPDARELGILGVGDLAWVEPAWDQPDLDPAWLRVVEPVPMGWIRADEGGEEVELIGQADWGQWTDILQIIPIPGGFAMQGSGTGIGPAGEAFLATSADGSRWEMREAPFDLHWGPSAMAWGPSGLLGMSVDWATSDLWVWMSGDATAWSPLGRLSDVYPDRLVASPAGYLMTSWGNRYTVWFSSDGSTWHEIPDAGELTMDGAEFFAGDIGFYAWDSSDPLGRGGAYSPDGRNWTRVNHGPGGQGLRVAELGAGMLALEPAEEAGPPVVWLSVADGWRELGEQDELGDVAITALVSDGRRAVAFGWERTTEEAFAASTTDGTTWDRISLTDEGFQGIPRVAAAGPRGVVVVVGYRPTLAGQNPVVWRELADGSWASEPEPLLELAAEPAPGDCPDRPADVLGLLMADRATTVACFGSESLALRLWATPCGDCHWEAPEGATYEPAWLAAPGVNQIHVAPIETRSAWIGSLVLHPSVEADLPPAGSWVQVTGHFDDAAATSCRRDPAPNEEWWYTGRQSIIDDCRKQFVVTELELVDGP